MLALWDTFATDLLPTVRHSWGEMNGEEHQRCFLGVFE